MNAYWRIGSSSAHSLINFQWRLFYNLQVVLALHCPLPASERPVTANYHILRQLLGTSIMQSIKGFSLPTFRRLTTLRAM